MLLMLTCGHRDLNMNGSQAEIDCCLARYCTPECNNSNVLDSRAQTSPQSYPTDVLEKAHTFPYEHLCGVSMARIDLVDEEFLSRIDSYDVLLLLKLEVVCFEPDSLRTCCSRLIDSVECPTCVFHACYLSS